MARERDAAARSTIRDVAARAGVSAATVSRVLSGAYRPPAETHDRIMVAVRELDYVASGRADTSLSGSIAIVTSNIRSDFYMNVVAGIEEQAVAAGRACLICSTGHDPKRELAVIKRMRQRGVEAVIIVGGLPETEDHRAHLAELATSLRRSGSRLVLCGRSWLGPATTPIAVVDYDAEGGAYAATSYLLSMGHRRIAHLSGPSGYVTTGLRIDGYRRALRDFGVESEPDRIVTAGMGRQDGYVAGHRMLAETDATAVFVASDMAAAGAVAAAREAGRRVPDDLSVVGFDDLILALDVFPALTTVHVPQPELGREAARRAMYAADDDLAAERITLGTHIVVRDSVSTPSP